MARTISAVFRRLVVAASVLGLAGQAAAEEYYYAVELNGVLCGYAKMVTLPLVQGGRTLTELRHDLVIRGTLLGAPVDNRLQFTYHIDPATGAFTYHDSAIEQGQTRLTSSIRVEGRTARVSDGRGGAEKVVELPEGVVLANTLVHPHLLADFVRRGLDRRTYQVFDGRDNAVREVVYTKTGAETLRLAGQSFDTVVLDSVDRTTGVTFTLWLDTRSGIGVQTRQPGGGRTYLTDASIVDAVMNAATRADLTTTVLTKANVLIRNVRGISYMKVRAVARPSGLRLTPEALSVPGQRFSGTVQDNLVDGVFEIEHPRYGGAQAPPFPPPDYSKDPRLRPHLEANDMIQAGDAALRDKAREITAGSRDSWEAARRLSAWVATEIKGAIPGGITARGTFDQRAGECGGHSFLMAALSRSVGIPARVVWGALYVPDGGGGFGRHGWNEVYMGAAGWIPLDTTIRETDYVDSGHLRIGVFQLSMATNFDLREVEILEHRVAPASGPQAGSGQGPARLDSSVGAVTSRSAVAAGTRQGAAGTDSKVAALIVSLGTRYWDKAVDDLVGIGEPALGPLLAELRTGKSPGRARISLALARIGTSAAVDAVHEALASPDPVMRENAATALASVKSDRSVTALIGAVTTDGWQVRRAAVASLGAIGDPRAVEALAGVLKDPAWYIRDEAIRALGRVKSKTAVAPLVAALDDPRGSVRQTARAALVAHGAAAVPEVAAALSASGSAVGWQAAWILGHIDAPDVIDPLLGALERGSPAIRVESAVGLARFGSRPGAVAGREVLTNGVTRLLGSGNPAVHDDAAWILERLRRPAGQAGTANRDGPAKRCGSMTRSSAVIGPGGVSHDGRTYRLYPETLDARPNVPSPLTAADGTELLVAVTASRQFGIVPVTLKPSSRQCDADGDDFPTLARTGLHSEAELDRARVITGRSVAEVSELGRPGGLSDAGFLNADEDMVSVLKADNRIVAALGLTHPELARPLFHVLNAMETDIALGRWNMSDHRWRNIASVFSHGRVVKLDAGDTKGGQQSVFDDGLEGSYWIEITADLTDAERAFLTMRYPRLDASAMDRLVQSLTRIKTGEIQPHYVTWYGFYEGSTPWRTDPIAVAFVFGLRTIEQIEAAFPGRVYELMMSRFVTDRQ